MALRANSKIKIDTYVRLLHFHCMMGKPFSPRELATQLHADQTITSHLVRAGILQNGGGHGTNKDCKYKWVGEEPSDKMIDELLVKIDQYRQESNKKRKQPEPQLALPAPALIVDTDYEDADPGFEEKVNHRLFHLEGLGHELRDQLIAARAEIMEVRKMLSEVTTDMAHQLNFLYNQFNK